MSTSRRGWLAALVVAAGVAGAAAAAGRAADNAGSPVFIRFRLIEPAAGRYYIRLGGYIHNDPWYLKAAVWPEGADKDATRRVAGGQATGWFDLGRHAGKLLHGRLNRAGGVAEFPCVTAEFLTDPPAEKLRIAIELATAPDEARIVRRLEESFTGSLTGFLVSPDLARDANALETASQMTARRLSWARQATGGQRISPKRLRLQTGFWGPQRPELNLQEAEVLWLLGFNVVGGQRPEVREKFAFAAPGHTHEVLFGPSATERQIDDLMKKHAARQKEPLAEGVPYGFSDEICARPAIGSDPNALKHFRQWLAERRIDPAALGVESLDTAVPIETPDDYRARREKNAPAAARAFYYASRFRQEAGTQRIRWHTEAFHRHFPGGALTSTLVADHPYFGGTGLGMGMPTPNFTWGGWPLALDWFDLARRKAVDLAGVEDWMGLQYMYGPDSTWEGFQLMGFQAAIFRSGSRGELPIIAWITPSDETNLRLKSASALCQGAKHFFYWTYGPTCASTENYWSDLRGAYDGVARIARQLAAAEPIIAPGTPRKTRLALLYSISSDLWQPFDYIHMLERRATYLSLVHGQYLVDMLTEQDVEAGRLAEYDVLYSADPCITAAAAAAIRKWVEAGGVLHGACAAGSRNEFDEPADVLAGVFGIRPEVKTATQPGRYRIRGGMNDIPYADRVRVNKSELTGEAIEFGVVGAKVSVTPAGGQVIGTFADGSPAVVANRFGKGATLYVAACPGLAYIKEAKFVRSALGEKWPADLRAFLHGPARRAGVRPLAELSAPVVEAGIYETDRATALILANFTYEPIAALQVRLAVRHPVRAIRSAEHGPIQFRPDPAGGKGPYPHAVTFTMPLGINDIVMVE